MTIRIPEKFTEVDFKNLKNKKLNNDDFQQYRRLFTENYKKTRGTTEYSLKEGVSEQELANIDFVLRRIGYNNQFDTLEDISIYFRKLLETKKRIALFAYNGMGKTRLSVAFKSIGQRSNEETGEKTADTLYYNAFTEDLFYWDNDLDNDTERVLKVNSSSRFF